ncbi:hypothetical protein BGZ51_005655 [Haplosporangium sp. Z 767]|nr:hypothetical protein BGZ50_008367 [Haplosporangium sp. Z 11]KAF9181150.1 hypothetical protein BGZ51_005655 [Haplosporangium sp. Z 767]
MPTEAADVRVGSTIKAHQRRGGESLRSNHQRVCPVASIERFNFAVIVSARSNKPRDPHSALAITISEASIPLPEDRQGLAASGCPTAAPTNTDSPETSTTTIKNISNSINTYLVVEIHEDSTATPV